MNKHLLGSFLPADHNEAARIANMIRNDVEQKIGILSIYDIENAKRQLVNGINWWLLLNIGKHEPLELMVYEPLPYMNMKPNIMWIKSPNDPH